MWNPTRRFVSPLGCQQDNFNLKLHSARDPGDKFWCVKPWCCARSPGPPEEQWYQKRTYFSGRQNLPAQIWYFLGDAITFSPGQTVPFQEVALPCLQSCIVCKGWIGYTWVHGTEKCRNAILYLQNHWSSDEIYGNRSGQNFVFFKSLIIYSEIGSCLHGSYPNSKNPINTYLHDRFTWVI